MEAAAKSRLNFPEGNFAASDIELQKKWRKVEQIRLSKLFDHVSDVSWDTISKPELEEKIQAALVETATSAENLERNVNFLTAAVEHPLTPPNDVLVRPILEDQSSHR